MADGVLWVVEAQDRDGRWFFVDMSETEDGAVEKRDRLNRMFKDRATAFRLVSYRRREEPS